MWKANYLHAISSMIYSTNTCYEKSVKQLSLIRESKKLNAITKNKLITIQKFKAFKLRLELYEMEVLIINIHFRMLNQMLDTLRQEISIMNGFTEDERNTILYSLQDYLIIPEKAKINHKLINYKLQRQD